MRRNRLPQKVLSIELNEVAALKHSQPFRIIDDICERPTVNLCGKNPIDGSPFDKGRKILPAKLTIGAQQETLPQRRNPVSRA